MILALDLGTSVGFAMLRDDDSVESGTWDVAPAKNQDSAWRFIHLKRRLQKLEGVECVAFERNMSSRGLHVVAMFGGFTAIVESWALERGIPIMSIAPTSLKKAITGNGRADKDAMSAAARKRFPDQLITSDDQGDALCVLDWTIEELARRKL